MSKAIKQILVMVAVVAIAMVFIVQFRPGSSGLDAAGAPRCAVEIAGDCIPHSDYLTAYRLAAPNIDADQLKGLHIRQNVVDGLIERWLLVQDAKRLGISVSDDEVKKYIASKSLARFSLPAAQEEMYIASLSRIMGGQLLPPPYGPARFIDVKDRKTNAFDYKRYQKWIHTSGKTEQAFLDYQVQETIAARMRALVRSRVHVSEAEAYEKYARANEKITVDYVKLERSYYTDYVLDKSEDAVTKWAGVNAKEVEAKWETSKDRFTPECRQARHILVRIDETASDKEAEKKRAEAVLQKAKARIDGGESFADVAREVSQDSSTKKDGGDLGCFAAGKLMKGAAGKKVDEAVYKLEAGKLSDVVESDHGLHLVLVEKIATGDEAVTVGKAAVTRELYVKMESERLAAEGAKQIIAAVKDGKKLEEALQAHLEAVLPAEAKAAYERGKRKERGEDVKEEPKEKPKDDKGDPKGEPKEPPKKDPPQKEGDKKEAPKKDAPKNEGDKKGEEKKGADKKEEKKEGQKKGDEEAKDGDADDDDGDDDDEDVADEDEVYDAWTDPARPQIRTSEAFTRDGAPFEGVKEGPAAASALFELKNPGEIAGDMLKLFDGYAVAQLKERTPVDEKKWDEERREYMESLEYQKQNDSLIAYLRRLREAHEKDIEVSPDLKETAEAPDEG